MAGPGGEIVGAPDILAAFRAAVEVHAARPAIVHGSTTISYAQLGALVDQTARRLGAALDGPAVVGVLATHSPATVAAAFGVWAAGGVYTPVDPTFPAARREAMLAAAGCGLLFDPGSGTIDVLAGADAGDAIAYTLFTSGSTGTPKPVLTPRTAISTAVVSLRDLFGLTPADRVLQFASLNWDTCFEEILPTLTSGATLVFDGDAHAGSFPRFLRMVRRARITVLNLPTAFWHELVTYLAQDGAGLPEAVRLVIIGGEAASMARLRDWRALPTGTARLLNTYGCTETTLITHAVDLHGPLAPPDGDEAISVKVPIGRALPHVVERITGDGELLIGGPALAAGYRGLPEVTAERFVRTDGCRFFRTGDRVSRAADGTLFPSGRLDAQIKIRGVRVDPAEVEAHIAAHPAVRAVAVAGVPVADHTVLAAYIVPRSHASPAGLPARIRDHLCGRLPAHLIPTHIRVVPDLVYTPSGKVDRHRIMEVMA